MLTSSSASRSELLESLLQFKAVPPELQKELHVLAGSSERRVSILSVLLLLRHHDPDPTLFHLLLNRLKGADSISLNGIDELSSLLVARASRSDEADLKELSQSPSPEVSFAALDSLRHIADPALGKFFVDELDSPDAEKQFIAMMALAETYQKYGDFAPGMDIFQKNPTKYINEWKQWYSQHAK